VRTLVVLRALGLGDLLTAVPALRALARAHPGHHRVLVAPRTLAPLAAWTGAVHDVIHLDGTRALPTLAALPAGADVAVNLHGRGPQSHRALLARRPGHLIAFRHPDAWPEPTAPHWREGVWEPARWVRLLAAHGIEGDPDELDLTVPRKLTSLVPPAWRDATVIHVGAASAARRWPLDRWAAVVAHEHQRGARVVLTGGSAERTLTRRLREATGLTPEHDLAGRTDLRRLAALVAVAGRVVCGDTGIAHLATAVGTPSVVLFGPTSPAEWGPPPDRPQHRALWAGRRGDPHSQVTDPGLLAITVADVIDAQDRLPALRPRPAPPADPVVAAPAPDATAPAARR
jgi:ADP-heptose:LPS heptosyltransferase